MIGAREEIIEEQQAQVLEDVRSIALTSRLAQPFKYLLHLSLSPFVYSNIFP